MIGEKFFFFKQKTAYEMRISDWSSDVCSSDLATTDNIPLFGVQTIDDVTVIPDDRVLVKNQNSGSENGIYVAAAGAWSRAADFNTSEAAVTGSQIGSASCRESVCQYV